MRNMESRILLLHMQEDGTVVERIKSTVMNYGVDVSLFRINSGLSTSSPLQFQGGSARDADTAVIVLPEPKKMDGLLVSEISLPARIPLIVIGSGQENHSVIEKIIGQRDYIYIDCKNYSEFIFRMIYSLEHKFSVFEGGVAVIVTFVMLVIDQLSREEKKKKLLGVMYVKRRGGSFSIVLPKKIAEKLDVYPNDIIGIYYSDGEMSLKKLE